MVDGIEPVSASMLSTVDLGLTWKNVTKGYRSRTRRSRKLANSKSLNASVEMDDKIPETGSDSSVFESEKFGVAVLGRRFANQVEHVPIRKRRFLLHTPSPPPQTPSLDHEEDSLSDQPQTPPQSEEPDQLFNCKLASDECSSPVSYSKMRNPDESNGELGYPIDMSGIELLVAAACSTSNSDDNVKESSIVEGFVTPEGTDLLTADGPLNENVALSVEEVKKPVKVGKFSWDLNVVMESDEPGDTFITQREDKEVVLDSKSSAVFTGKDPALDNSCLPETHVVKENISTIAVSGENYSRTSTVPLGKSSVQIVQSEEEDVAFPKMIGQEHDVCEIDRSIQSKDGDDIGNTCKTHIVGNSSSHLDKVDNIIPSPNHDEFSASSTSIVDVQPIAISSVKGHDDKASTAYTDINDIPVHIQPKEPIPKCHEHLQGETMSQGLCHVYSENPTNSIDKLSSEEGGRMGGEECVGGHQVGYESPFEDGELRDSIIYSWDVNEVDERDTECVDYESSNADDFDDTVDYSRSENFDVGHEGGQIMGRGSLSVGNKDNEVEIGIVEKKGNLLMPLKRSDNLGGDSYGRAERQFGSDSSTGRKKSFQVYSKNKAGGQWLDSSSVGYWDTRNCYPSNYNTEGGDYSRPRGLDLITNSASKDGNLNFNDERRPINYSSKGTYRPLIRRRSPPLLDRDNRYPINRGASPVRGISRDRSRGRSGIYQQGFHDDSAATSVRMPHSLSRERDFSLNFCGANFSLPRGKSRSRSRTRSPILWKFNRHRNMGNRRQRSPDFRSESKIEGGRLTFQKPSFIDYEESFIFPSRGRSPPQRYSTRWFDDQNRITDDFGGGRRSPSPQVRILRRPQRHFDSDSWSYSSRPVVRRRKSPPVTVMGGWGRKNEGSEEDRRKHDNRHMPINRVRPYDEGGVVRRFRYDAEYCLEARNSQNEANRGGFRGTKSRKDVPRSSWEERCPPHRYHNGDRVYTNASLVYELQNYEGNAAAASQRVG